VLSDLLGGPIVSIALLVPATTPSPSAWRDPSPHRVRFVAVDSDVQLEVLDWGGAGRPVVLLAGGGNTAHVFDEFAPKLTPYGLRDHAAWVRGVGLRDAGPTGAASP
jgi:pimeloyl-ACP methyl ester carboxylesterase